MLGLLQAPMPIRDTSEKQRGRKKRDENACTWCTSGKMLRALLVITRAWCLCIPGQPCQKGTPRNSYSQRRGSSSTAPHRNHCCCTCWSPGGWGACERFLFRRFYALCNRNSVHESAHVLGCRVGTTICIAAQKGSASHSPGPAQVPRLRVCTHVHMRAAKKSPARSCRRARQKRT